MKKMFRLLVGAAAIHIAFTACSESDDAIIRPERLDGIWDMWWVLDRDDVVYEPEGQYLRAIFNSDGTLVINKALQGHDLSYSGTYELINNTVHITTGDGAPEQLEFVGIAGDEASAWYYDSDGGQYHIGIRKQNHLSPEWLAGTWHKTWIRADTIWVSDEWGKIDTDSIDWVATFDDDSLTYSVHLSLADSRLSPSESAVTYSGEYEIDCDTLTGTTMDGLSERMEVLSIMSANTIIVRHMRDRAGMSGTVIGMKRY